MTPIRIAAFVSLLIAAAGSVPAAAETPTVRYGVVPTSGLDLSTASGRAALSLRIRQEASALCGTPDYEELRDIIAVKTCRAEALRSVSTQVDAAIARVGNPSGIVRATAAAN